VGRLLHDFNTEFSSPSPTPAEFATRFAVLLARDDVIVLIAQKRAAVGLALLTLRPTPYGDGPLAQLEELYVVPEQRGRGVGSALMVALVREAAAAQAIEIDVAVDEDDVDAYRFYLRHRFVASDPGREDRTFLLGRELSD
jgi:ribosomal protein S18 acetylase RimI-like enzyme